MGRGFPRVYSGSCRFRPPRPPPPMSIFAAAGNPAVFPNLGYILGVLDPRYRDCRRGGRGSQLERFRRFLTIAARLRHRPMERLASSQLFFEWLGWVAYPLIAIGLPRPAPLASSRSSAPHHVLAAVHVSGVRRWRRMVRLAREEFRLYRKRVTPLFVPAL